MARMHKSGLNALSHHGRTASTHHGRGGMKSNQMKTPKVPVPKSGQKTQRVPRGAIKNPTMNATQPGMGLHQHIGGRHKRAKAI